MAGSRSSWIKVLYFFSTLIYLWVAYFLGATFLLNIFLPGKIIIRDAALNYTSIWSTSPFRFYLRNAELELESTEYARLKLGYIMIKIDPISLFRDNIRIMAIDIDGMEIFYKKGAISKIGGDTVLIKRNPGKHDKNSYILPEKSTITAKNISITNINNLSSRYVRMKDNIALNLDIEVDDKIHITDFSVNFHDSNAYSGESDTMISNSLYGYLKPVRQDFENTLESFVFGNDHAFRLKVCGILDKSFFARKKSSRNDIYNIIGGAGRIDADFTFRKNDILEIRKYSLFSTHFEIIYREFGLSGTAELEITQKEDYTALILEMKDIRITQGSEAVSYPEGFVKVEIYNPALSLNSIAFITPDSYGSISIQKGENDPFSYYQSFNANNWISSKELACFIYEDLLFYGKALF